METTSGTVGEAPSHHRAAVPATATKVPLTVVIPTLNEAAQLAELLASLCWVDEVIVADGGSTDATVAIARARGATVIERPGGTIAAQRNDAIECARNEWVFALDADERISNPLREELGRGPPIRISAAILRGTFFNAAPAGRASSGNTVTCLPPCHWITTNSARVFWNLSSNFTPHPVG